MTAAAPGTPTFAFSEVTGLVSDEAGHWQAQVNPEWTIGGKPNGGYLLALLARAAVLKTGHQHVIAASGHFLRAPEPGPVSIHPDLLRAGRSSSQVRARLEQDGQSCVEALFTVSDLSGSSPAYWDKGLPTPNTVAFDDCIRLPSLTPLGLRVNIMDQVDLRLEPESLGFGLGRPRGLGELRGWLALLDGEAFDPISLVYAADAFPPATFDIEMTGWVPTLELTVYVRALPAPGPVRLLQKAQLIAGQRFDEACFIWDSAGTLVAHGTQLAGIRLG